MRGMPPDQNEFTVKLQPAVSEQWLAKVVGGGASPNEFASWALRKLDLEDALDRFVNDSYGAELLPSRGKHHTQHEEEDSTPARTVVVRPRQASWSKERFMAFLDLVKSIDDMRPSMTLLGAYVVLGPVPSSSALKNLTLFAQDQAWQQALRVAKQRLTIQARRMESPGLFRRAKAGPRGERLHPIEPLLYGWLKEWGQMEGEDVEVPEKAFPDPGSWGPSDQSTDGEE